MKKVQFWASVNGIPEVVAEAGLSCEEENTCPSYLDCQKEDVEDNIKAIHNVFGIGSILWFTIVSY